VRGLMLAYPCIYCLHCGDVAIAFGAWLFFPAFLGTFLSFLSRVEALAFLALRDMMNGSLALMIDDYGEFWKFI